MVTADASIRSVLISITEYRLGATVVIEDEKILGIITDGDIRRMLGIYEDVSGLQAKDIMSLNPKTIDKTELAANALHLMRQNSISQLVVTAEGKYAGIIHLQDILKEGII